MKKRFNFHHLCAIAAAIALSLWGCGSGFGDDDPGGPSGPGDPERHGILGKVSFESMGLANVSLVCKKGSDSVTVVSGDEGYYASGSLSAGMYTVIPSKKGWTFTPSSFTVNFDGNDVDGYDFDGWAAASYRVDSWGYIWDDTMRGPATLAKAEETCAALGGRLPTPTEIFRNNSASGYGLNIVGNEADYLWTNIEYDVSQNVTVRLSNGETSQTAKTSTRYYRCVYPDKDRSFFSKNYICGPPGDEGFALTSNGNTFYMDKYDRPLLTYNSAVREAAFYHAHVAPELNYTEAIKSGLPNGSNQWLWASDQEGYNNTQFVIGQVRWTDVDTNFTDAYSTYANWSYMDGKYGYRCIGIGKEVQAASSGTSNEWVGGTTFLRSVTVDRSQANFYDAIDACLDSGGHVPTFLDLMEMIQAGLPNGSNTHIWTSDIEAGVTGSQLNGIVRWNGTDTSFTGMYSTYGDWGYRADTDLHPYRPVYYPVNEDYNGPDASTFHQDSFVLTRTNPNGKTIKIWADAYNRDAVVFHEAVKTCYDLGGHLGTFRDMVELIRNGLPNGIAPQRLWTSDLTRYEYTKTIAWGSGSADGTEPDFRENENIHNPRNGAEEHCYRCVWTNEIRVH
ncbi:MAG: carboxypeptidase regulatory-like domain-containing protein [bacterium]|nr:carboxypeptidase regulatory-like domain-containing protein [bacterium]